MKRILFFLALTASINAYAQTGNFDKVNARQSISVAGKTVVVFDDDTAFTAQKTHIPTQYGVFYFLRDRLASFLPLGAPNQPLLNLAGNRYIADDIIKKCRCIITQAQLDSSKNTFVTQAQLFAKGARISGGGTSTAPNTQVLNDTLRVNAENTNSFSLDSVNGIINSTYNTGGHIAILMGQALTKYAIQANNISAHGAVDNDRIGFVIAFVEDRADMVINALYHKNPADFNWPANVTDSLIPNQHTISVYRNRDNVTSQYYVVYDAGRLSEQVLFDGTSMLSYKPTSNWASDTTAFQLKATRNGDTLRIYTTEFADAPGGMGALGHEITILLSGNPLLNKFRGQTDFGFASQSQANAYWQGLSYTDNTNNIYNMRNGDVWVADFDGNYTIDTTKNAIDEIGQLRMWFNPAYNIFGYNGTDTAHLMYDGGIKLSDTVQAIDLDRVLANGYKSDRTAQIKKVSTGLLIIGADTLTTGYVSRFEVNPTTGNLVIYNGNGETTINNNLRVNDALAVGPGVSNGPRTYLNIAGSNTNTSSLRINPGDEHTTEVTNGDTYLSAADNHLYTYINGAYRQLDNEDVITFASIAEMEASTTTAIACHVTDSLRGGYFVKYNNASIGLDSGTNFPSASGANYRWCRQYNQTTGLNPEWFGAIGDWNLITNTGTDNVIALRLCLASQAHSNTPMVFSKKGIYGCSDTLVLGTGTLIQGLNPLFPTQFVNATDSINYTIMSGIYFYNNTSGFVTSATDGNTQRSQGVTIKDIAILGNTRPNTGSAGVLFRRTNNVGSLKTVGLITMHNIYINGFDTSATGYNTADTWHMVECHFTNSYVGVVGGTGQMYVSFCDFYNLATRSIISNAGPTPGDIIANNEIEPRYSDSASVLINGQNATVYSNKFLTNKYSVEVSKTAQNTHIFSNDFYQSSNDNIIIDSGAINTTLTDNKFVFHSVTTSLNYNRVVEVFNSAQVFVRARKADALFLYNNTVSVGTSGSYSGTYPMVFDTCTNMLAQNNYQPPAINSLPDERAYDFTGSTFYTPYDVADRYIRGNLYLKEVNTPNFVGFGKIVTELNGGQTDGKFYFRGGVPGTVPGMDLTIFKSEGTLSSPTGLLANSILSRISGVGYNTSAFTGTRISYTQVAAQDWSTSAAGTAHRFAWANIGNNSMNRGANFSQAGLYSGDTSTLAVARLQTAAGNTTIPPIVLGVNGVVTTTPIAGALESNNTSLFFTDTIATVKTRREIVLLDKAQTLTNKTIAAGSNTITGITNTNLSGSAAITNANLATMANNTVKGNVSGSTAVPSDLTATQITTLVNAFTSSLSGAAPASGGGTTNFLRADGTWQNPVANYMPLSGGSMTGTIFLNGHTIDGSNVGSTILRSYATSNNSIVSWSEYNYYTGTGGDTWTLPATSPNNTGKLLIVKNEGSGNVTISSTGSESMFTTTVVTSLVLTPGQSATFHNNTVYWDVRQ